VSQAFRKRSPVLGVHECQYIEEISSREAGTTTDLNQRKKWNCAVVVAFLMSSARGCEMPAKYSAAKRVLDEPFPHRKHP